MTIHFMIRLTIHFMIHLTIHFMIHLTIHYTMHIWWNFGLSGNENWKHFLAGEEIRRPWCESNGSPETWSMIFHSHPTQRVRHTHKHTRAHMHTHVHTHTHTPTHTCTLAHTHMQRRRERVSLFRLSRRHADLMWPSTSVHANIQQVDF